VYSKRLSGLRIDLAIVLKAACDTGIEGFNMTELRIVRIFLLAQAAIFVVAVSIHFGWQFTGYQHRAAGTAESIIACVLITGLLLTWSRWARVAAIAAQSFGVLGVLVGLFTIAVGVGPRTALDLAIHALMLVVLIAGLVVTVKRPGRAPAG